MPGKTDLQWLIDELKKDLMSFYQVTLYVGCFQLICDSDNPKTEGVGRSANTKFFNQLVTELMYYRDQLPSQSQSVTELIKEGINQLLSVERLIEKIASYFGSKNSIGLSAGDSLQLYAAVIKAILEKKYEKIFPEQIDRAYLLFNQLVVTRLLGPLLLAHKQLHAELKTKTKRENVGETDIDLDKFYESISLSGPFAKEGGLQTCLDNIAEQLMPFANQAQWLNPTYENISKMHLPEGFEKLSQLRADILDKAKRDFDVEKLNSVIEEKSKNLIESVAEFSKWHARSKNSVYDLKRELSLIKEMEGGSLEKLSRLCQYVQAKIVEMNRPRFGIFEVQHRQSIVSFYQIIAEFYKKWDVFKKENSLENGQCFLIGITNSRCKITDLESLVGQENQEYRIHQAIKVHRI